MNAIDAPGVDQTARAEEWRRLRALLHQALLASIETEGASILDDGDQARRRLQRLFDDTPEVRRRALSLEERERLEAEVLAELGGLGPLAPLMVDAEISDILINGPQDVWVDRFGRLEKTDVRFDDQAHLRRFLDRLVAAQGRHLDEGSPLVDARMDDGSRLHALIPPLCAIGPVVSIRRFRIKPFLLEELIAEGVLVEPMAALLQLAVRGRLNIVVSGGAASGKTTLLNTLSSFIDPGERVITIEETTELRLQHDHVIALEARPANVEGRGEISLRNLVRNALRMRADRILVGEVRGPEVLDMLQAMNVGHDGSMTTVHANSADDVLRRLESLVLMSGIDLPRRAVQEMLGAAFQLIVHLVRYRDGSRRIASIREVVSDGDSLGTCELFRFELDSVDEAGRVHGRAVSTGARPACIERLRERGFDLSALSEMLDEAGELSDASADGVGERGT